MSDENERSVASAGSVAMSIESMDSHSLLVLVCNGSPDAMSEALKRLHAMDKVPPMRKDWDWFCISPDGLGLFPFPNEREARAYSLGAGMRLAKVVSGHPANGWLGCLLGWWARAK